MPKKLIMLSALTAVLVFGYMGLFSRYASADPPPYTGQVFLSTGASAVSVEQCYDTNAANRPTFLLGRLACNPANPTLATIGPGVPVFNWQITNLPLGNKLTVPVTYTPSAAGQWTSAAVPCTVNANNRCTDDDGPGVVTGNVASRTDIGCNQIIDIVASGGPGGPASLWPDSTLWTPAATSFRRIAQNPAVVAGTIGVPSFAGELQAPDPDAYIHAAHPFPPTFTFRSADMALTPFLYLGGTLPFAVSGMWGAAAKLATVAYTSSYDVAGLAVSVPLPTDLGLCGDGPQDSVVQVNYMVTPACAPGCRIPRWTLLQSAPDLVTTVTDRILSWQCDIIGTPAGVDSDGDCLEDTSATELLICDPWHPGIPASTLMDCDDDLVPDGVEVFYGSDPDPPDTDGDGAWDYDELFQFTDPNDADTDGDGQADKQDIIPTNGPVPSAGCLNPEQGAAGGGACAATGGLGVDQFDATDDNCPNRANTNQLNTDALWQYHGMGGNIGATNTSTGDRTNPDEDAQGDVCDTDDDNDGIPDTTETTMRIRTWSGNFDDSANGDPEGAGDGTTVCAGPDLLPGTFMPIRVMSSILGDVDHDYVLDGAECSFGSRPDASCRVGGSSLCQGDWIPGSGLQEAQACASGVVDATATGGGPAIYPLNPAGTVTRSGCAQPAGVGASCIPPSATPSTVASPKCSIPSTSSDPDSASAGGADALYQPFNSVAHTDIETFYRTRGISVVGPDFVNDIDGDTFEGNNDADSDRDTAGFTGTSAGLKDGIEVRFYGTAPSNRDTDGDGCYDGDEWTDINGDGVQNPGDNGLRAAATGGHDVSPANGMIDAARYAIGTNRDFNKDGTNNPADAGILAAAISAPGGCPAETGTAPSRATQHLP